MSKVRTILLTAEGRATGGQDQTMQYPFGDLANSRLNAPVLHTLETALIPLDLTDETAPKGDFTTPCKDP